MPDSKLRLLTDHQDGATPGRETCRTVGCAGCAMSQLGFCAACEARYKLGRARRSRLVDAVCARLAKAGDPLFAVFGGRPRHFGAHVVAHLVELEAQSLHVPPSAVDDYVAELDENARRSG